MLLLVAVLAVGLGVFLMVRQSTSVAVRRVELSYPDLPSGLDGFTILFISDLHSQRFGSGQSRLLEQLADEDWDVAILGGDYVVDAIEPAAAVEVDPALFLPAAELVRGLVQRGPVYYVLGNYEGTGTYSYYPLPRCPAVAVLEAAGARSVYPAVRIEHNEGYLWLSDWSRRPYGANASTWPDWGPFPADLDESKDFVVAVTHRPLDLENPDRVLSPTDQLPPDGSWRAVDQIDWDLSLSGHTHGGQWRLPGIGPLISNVEQGHLPFGILPLHGDRYVQGVTRIESEKGVHYQVISSGIGESGLLPMRFRLFSQREVLLVTLRSDPADT